MKGSKLVLWPVSHYFGLKNMDPKSPPKANYKIEPYADAHGHLQSVVFLIPICVMCWLTTLAYSVR